MSRSLTGATLLLALLVGRLAAQGKPPLTPEIRRLQVRADSLARLWDEADALANLADSLAHGEIPSRLDTMIVGSLVIISNPSPLPLEAAAKLAWGQIDSTYGTRAQELKEHPYLVHAVDPDSQYGRTGQWGIRVPWDKSVEELADILALYAPIPAPDKPLHDWAIGGIRPAIRGSRVELEQSYVALVTAHYAVGRDCFAGSIEDCRSLLGLDRPVDPIKVFRTPAERQDAIGSMGFSFRYNEVNAAVQACRNGDDGACISTIRQATSLPSPVGYVARQTVIRVALAMGGRDSYARLTADSTMAIDQRLSSAAGVPLDSLLSVWRSSVILARPTPVELPGYGPFVGLGWVLVLGMLALRSSRWRVA